MAYRKVVYGSSIDRLMDLPVWVQLLFFASGIAIIAGSKKAKEE